ncbi:MAG: MEDS domain-containing protein [Syntrophomonas sp.]
MLDDFDISKSMNEIKPRAHLCLIYRSEEEWERAVTVFIEKGLENREKCLYIYNSHRPDRIRKSLEEEGVDLGTFENSGHFIFYSFDDFFRNSERDIFTMIYFLSKLSETSKSEGYTGLRVAIEIKCGSDSFQSQDILEFEARLNRYFFSKHACTALCLYKQDEHEQQFIKDIITTHPLIARGDRFYRNSRYMMPGEILCKERNKKEIDSLLNIIERENKNNESLNFLNKVFNESLQAFCSLSPNGSIIICNQAFCDVVGYQNHQLHQSVKFTDLITADYLDAHWQAVKNINTSGVPQRYEVEMQKQDGSSIYVEILLHQTVGRLESNIYYYLFMNNITERKKAEAALEETKQHFADIINFLPDPTLVIDKSGRVIAWNKAIEKMTGVKARKILGKGDHEYAIPIYGRKRPLLADQVLLQNQKGHYYTSVKKEGNDLIAESYTPQIKNKETFLWCKATPLYNVKGELIGVIETIRDITHFKTTEERLRF